MSAETKSFLFLRERDWRTGLCGGVRLGEDGLTADDGRGWYVSCALDAGEGGTCWHRLRLLAALPPNARLEMYLMAAEEREDTDALLLDPAIPPEKKRALFERYGTRYLNPGDLPLFSHVGRYLWFYMDLTSQDGAPVRITSLKLEFPRTAFIDYLPYLYRKGPRDAFLARFLMLFQSVYVDYEEKLEATPGLFDPAAAPRPYVEWMADWFALREAADWGEARLRLLLPHAARLSRSKGTCASIRFLIQSYTGEAPMLIEQFDALERESAREKRPVLLRLFGESERAFTVLVSRRAAPDDPALRALRRLLDSVTGLDAVSRLAVLPEGIALDGHSYLGINTRLPAPTARRVGEMELSL